MEEFAVLLPGITNVDDIIRVAERIRSSIGSSPISVDKDGKNIELPVTVSIGGGVYRGGSATEFFSRVDTIGLYGAKTSGKNKVVIVPPKIEPLEQVA